MYIYDAPLAATLHALQAGQHSLSLYLEEICRRIDQVNPVVEALLPETNRLGRLRQETAQLPGANQPTTTWPPLYG